MKFTYHLRNNVYYFLILMMVGCGRPAGKDFFTITKEDVIQVKDGICLSAIADSVSYIKLETTPESLIGEYATTVVSSEEIVIFDHEQGILLFDRTGKFKFKIAGYEDRGPLGYSGICYPPVIHEDRTICLKRYDGIGFWSLETGQFIKKIDLSLLPYNFLHILPGDSVLLGWDSQKITDKESFLLALSAKDGRILKRFNFYNACDVNNPATLFHEASSYNYGNYIMHYYFRSDTLLKINKSTMQASPHIVFDYEINTDEPKNFNNYVTMSGIFETSTIIFMNFNYREELYNAYLNKVTGKLISYRKYSWTPGVLEGISNDIDNGVPFYPSFTFSLDRVGRQVQALNLVKDAPELAKKLQISEGDNPVLMIVSLRTR